MNPRPYIISIGWLVALVPWFFQSSTSYDILGFPPWALFSFAMTIGYAVLAAILYQKYWSNLEGGDE